MTSMKGFELFNTYQQDFQTLHQSIQHKIDQQIPVLYGDERKNLVNAVERELDEAEEILGQMDLEIMNSSVPQRTHYQAQLRQHKSEQEEAKNDLRRLIASKSNYHRQELFGDLESQDQIENTDVLSLDQRQQLLSGIDRLGESSRRLEQSHRMALETESVGASILTILKGQRETMTRARDTLAEADTHIDKASRTLKTMAYRMATNKIITAAIILILIVLIIFIIYSKLF
ncbi:t-SNARE [Chlamydoabsidia padenii]|nr:t-SNARE [Chlamydoabsidia padenii]